MKTQFQLFFSALCLLSFTPQLSAQSNLYIDTTATIEEMIVDFFNNPDVNISNISHIGSPISSGFFDAQGTDLGLSAGIVFTTGHANFIAYPAALQSAKPLEPFSSATEPDPDLSLLSNNEANNFDYTIIEFDFMSTSEEILFFQYIFASEEYPEFACSPYNDAFGFLVSGPNINGPYSNGAVNICTLPNSELPVSINTVNDNPDCVLAEHQQYFVDNLDNEHIAFDGKTTPLNAAIPFLPNETYHIKMVIGDISDQSHDSGIFLSLASLGSDSLLVPPTAFNYQITEGNTLVLENESKYARTWQWDFGNGQTSTERHPAPVTYQENGIYTVSLITQNFCCSDTITQDIQINTVSTEDLLAEQSNIQIYPNPITNNNFSIQLAAQTDIQSIKIYNLAGQEQGFAYSAQQNSIHINFHTNVEQGIYILEIKDQNGQSFNQRFVK